MLMWPGRLLHHEAVTYFQDLLRALDDAGLWSDVGERQKHMLIQALEAGEDVTWTAGGAWRADGEDLADGDVEAWLGSMAPALADCGVDLGVATLAGPHDAGSAGYSVSVNETVLGLYSFADDEPGLPATEDPWMDCTVRPAAEVNRLLAVAGSKRRVAVFWPGGNDGFSVLGDEGVLRLTSERGSSWAGQCVIP
jgi:hypothetical protein